jgi:hypothetical protein
MGLLFVERLEGVGVFRCRKCRMNATSKDSIIFRDFYCHTSHAYLFDHVYQHHAYNNQSPATPGLSVVTLSSPPRFID